jgi:hypothetical protein
MKSTLGIVIWLLLIAVPALAQDVHIDYDRWARFTTFKTYAWVDSPETSLAKDAPLMDERIKAAIIDQLSTGRLKMVTSDPDLYVTYHAAFKDKLRLNTMMSIGYGYPSGWAWDPYWGGAYTTTSATTYTEGTLIIDIWNAREKTLVWRGSATTEVSSSSEKNAKKVEKAVKKIAAKWEKMKPGF